MTVVDEAETGDGKGKDYNREWLYISIPIIPALLLSLRIWYLSGQSVEITQFVVQHINPASLLVELFFAILWMISTSIIVAHCAGRLLELSRDKDSQDFFLVRLATKIPIGAHLASFLVALSTWHVQFLPILLMLAIISTGLHARLEYPDRPWLIAFLCYLFPLLAIAALYVMVLPTAQAAWHEGDHFLALILTSPPVFGLFLNYRLPHTIAPFLVRCLLVCTTMILAPLAILKFLNASFLPAVAVEVAPPAQVHTGYIINMSDVATAILDLNGSVHFFPNGKVKSQVLCRDYTRAPYSKLDVNGWRVEETLSDALNSERRHAETDQR